ncbi:MAG: NADPH-dependent F420 reductase, partial [Streptosporangiaceae bacterium]
TPPFPQWQAEHPQVRLMSFAEAAAFAGLVMNATSGSAAMAALVAAGEAALAGKVLIDVSNPLDFSRGMPPTLDPVNTDSLGEQIQRAFPAVRVVKALNTMNCQVMVAPGRVPGEHNVFLCGNDETAKQAAAELIGSFGWPAGSLIDLGDISAARGTEMLMPLWLRLMGALGHADFNFHVPHS